MLKVLDSLTCKFLSIEVTCPFNIELFWLMKKFTKFSLGTTDYLLLGSKTYCRKLMCVVFGGISYLT